MRAFANSLLTIPSTIPSLISKATSLWLIIENTFLYSTFIHCSHMSNPFQSNDSYKYLYIKSRSSNMVSNFLLSNFIYNYCWFYGCASLSLSLYTRTWCQQSADKYCPSYCYRTTKVILIHLISTFSVSSWKEGPFKTKQNKTKTGTSWVKNIILRD